MYHILIIEDDVVRDHVKELMRANLLQIKSSLDVWTDSYEDILFQNLYE